MVTRAESIRLRRGRPWVSRDRLVGGLAGRRPGSVVEVLDPAGEWLGRGFVEPEGPIAVRIATIDPDEALDGRWVTRRLREAFERRRKILPMSTTQAFRLANAEGDGLPGLVLDWYDGHVAGIANIPAWAALEGAIAGGLARLPGFRGFGWKRGPGVVRSEISDSDASHYSHIRGAAPPDDLVVEIDGLRLHAGIRHGLNTGLFLDQRENRRRVGDLCAGKTLCNTFAYTGAFSAAAAFAGSKRVTTLDLSKRAIELARANLRLNGIAPEAHEFVAGDVFDWLPRWAAQGRTFDVVLLDPPSFATGRRRAFSAARHYGELVARACRILSPDGCLIASCNTASWSAPEFALALQSGAREAGRSLRILERCGLPPDFPVPKALPEMDYLKGVVARV